MPAQEDYLDSLLRNLAENKKQEEEEQVKIPDSESLMTKDVNALNGMSEDEVKHLLSTKEKTPEREKVIEEDARDVVDMLGDTGDDDLREIRELLEKADQNEPIESNAEEQAAEPVADQKAIALERKRKRAEEAAERKAKKLAEKEAMEAGKAAAQKEKAARKAAEREAKAARKAAAQEARAAKKAALEERKASQEAEKAAAGSAALAKTRLEGLAAGASFDTSVLDSIVSEAGNLDVEYGVDNPAVNAGTRAAEAAGADGMSGMAAVSAGNAGSGANEARSVASMGSLPDENAQSMDEGVGGMQFTNDAVGADGVQEVDLSDIQSMGIIPDKDEGVTAEPASSADEASSDAIEAEELFGEDGEEIPIREKEDSAAENGQEKEKKEKEEEKKEKGKKADKKKAEKRKQPKKQQAKKQQPKKPKAPKKPKEPKPEKEKTLPSFGRIPIKKLIPILLFGLSLGVFLIVSAHAITDYTDKSTARTAYYAGDYQTCYQNLFGKDLNESEQVMFGKSESILHIRLCLREYEMFVEEGNELRALDSLIQTIDRYPDLYSYAVQWNAGSEVSEVYAVLLSTLSEKYGLTEEQARVIAAEPNDREYTRQVVNVVRGIGYEIGIELPEAPETQEPGEAEASQEVSLPDELPEEGELEADVFIEN